MMIIDFHSLSEAKAALYEGPYEYVRQFVKPDRDKNRDARRRRNWWLHGAAGSDFRLAAQGLHRFLVTPRVAKHRVFAWLHSSTLPDSRLFAFTRQDDYFFGVLHSRPHEVWSIRTASRHGVGNDPTYNVTTCFETFPHPWPPGQEPPDDPRVVAIAAAAADLDRLRRNWLDPAGADATTLKTRTLTALYNARPAWLANLHAALDRTVWAAYGWADSDPAAVAEDDILARLLALNLARSTTSLGPAGGEPE